MMSPPMQPMAMMRLGTLTNPSSTQQYRRLLTMLPSCQPTFAIRLDLGHGMSPTYPMPQEQQQARHLHLHLCRLGSCPFPPN